MGLEDFEDAHFNPAVLIDCVGAHEFHFQTRLLGTQVALDAFELENGVPAGYQFQIIGDPEDDLLSMLAADDGILLRHVASTAGIAEFQREDYPCCTN